MQTRFEDRVLQDQMAYRNEAEKKLSQAEAILKDTTELGIQDASVKLQEGIAYRTEIGGRIEMYERTTASEGARLVALAEAEKTRLINEAYMGEGSDLLVGLEMARALRGLEKILIPTGGSAGFNPLDIEAVINQISGVSSDTRGQSGENEDGQ